MEEKKSLGPEEAPKNKPDALTVVGVISVAFSDVADAIHKLAEVVSWFM